ncbi:hypothetical protein B296_00001353 [Ensete ventricosum]|uniref:Uncharacterized protein n=1 Tax=Ensete ventricosum TaxID=4639 RepID=A0A426Z3G5_ENSVE|nr:hypothetical protein B296_00001353 [Ensete ventricosum]
MQPAIRVAASAIDDIKWVGRKRQRNDEAENSPARLERPASKSQPGYPQTPTLDYQRGAPLVLVARTPLCGSTGRGGGLTTFGARKRAVNVARALDTCQSWRGCPSRNPTNLRGSLLTPASTPFIRRWEHTFPHPRVILELT